MLYSGNIYNYRMDFMEYSITSLAQQARVSVRTLRHYDQIGLLKPAIRMVNGRRFYGDEQFLLLCEIIFFKKMGLSLSKIKKIFLKKPYSKEAAAVLVTRRHELTKEIQKLQRYVASIDMTIPYYKNCTLSQKERFDKFRSLQNTMQEIEELQMNKFGKKTIEDGKKKIIALSEEKVDELVERSNKLMKEAIQAIEEGLKPDSTEVQVLIQSYYDLLTEFNPVTKEIFLKLKEAVLEQKETYLAYHPKLPEFLYESMGIFANKLSGDKND